MQLCPQRWKYLLYYLNIYYFVTLQKKFADSCCISLWILSTYFICDCGFVSFFICSVNFLFMYFLVFGSSFFLMNWLLLLWSISGSDSSWSLLWYFHSQTSFLVLCVCIAYLLKPHPHMGLKNLVQQPLTFIWRGSSPFFFFFFSPFDFNEFIDRFGFKLMLSFFSISLSVLLVFLFFFLSCHFYDELSVFTTPFYLCWLYIIFCVIFFFLVISLEISARMFNLSQYLQKLCLSIAW